MKPGARATNRVAAGQTHLNGSDSCTSRAAPRILPSLRAWAKAFSSTSPPRAAFTRNAPCLICGGKEKLVNRRPRQQEALVRRLKKVAAAREFCRSGC